MNSSATESASPSSSRLTPPALHRRTISRLSSAPTPHTITSGRNTNNTLVRVDPLSTSLMKGASSSNVQIAPRNRGLVTCSATSTIACCTCIASLIAQPPFLFPRHQPLLRVLAPLPSVLENRLQVPLECPPQSSRRMHTHNIA